MTFPSFILGCLIASIFSCAFHFWKGGGLGKLILYNIFGWVGFWGGYLIGLSMGWKFIVLGPLNLGVSILFTIAALFTGYWLSLVKINNK